MENSNKNAKTNPLRETNGDFSIRKVATYMSLILFAYCVISYTIANGFKEIPVAYSAIIGTIILFYFAKKPIENINTPKDITSTTAINDKGSTNVTDITSSK